MPRAAPKQPLSILWHAAAFVLLYICVSLVLIAAVRGVQSEETLTIWMFDVGQGDALFIEFPTGEQWVIDGGRDDAVLAKLGSVMWPWDRTLDAIVVTHPDADHITGLTAILERYKVNTIYETGARAHTRTDASLVHAMSQENAHRPAVHAHQEWFIGDVQVQVIWPEAMEDGSYPDNRNEASIVLLLTYQDHEILLTGDIEAQTEHAIADTIGDIDVLKVGHHGSISSTSWELLEHTSPEVALISSGENNRYGHPHPIVIDRLNTIGAQVFRTDTQGDIRLTSDGQTLEAAPRPLPY